MKTLGLARETGDSDRFENRAAAYAGSGTPSPPLNLPQKSNNLQALVVAEVG